MEQSVDRRRLQVIKRPHVPARLEHRVRVGVFRRKTLEHVPVLDDLAVLVEAEDVDARPRAVLGPVLETSRTP